MKALRFLIPLVTGLVSTGLLAHHGAVTNSALYNTDEILELEGELIEVLWQNPHTRGRLSVVNDAGEESVWEVELGPGPNSMARRGLAAEDFLGRVKIAGHVARRGTNGLGALHVLLPDGREIVQSNRSLRWGSVEVANRPAVLDPAKVAAAREAADGIFRMWSGRRGTNIEPQLRALDLEFTDRGRELNAAYDPLEDNIEVVECRQGMPDAMFDPVPMEITNEGDRIIIHTEQYNIRRTVYMDPEARSGGARSVGHRPLDGPVGRRYVGGHHDPHRLAVLHRNRDATIRPGKLCGALLRIGWREPARLFDRDRRSRRPDRAVHARIIPGMDAGCRDTALQLRH